MSSTVFPCPVLPGIGPVEDTCLEGGRITALI